MFIIPEYYILEAVNQLKIIGINNQLRIPDDVMFVNGILATAMNNFFLYRLSSFSHTDKRYIAWGKNALTPRKQHATYEYLSYLML